MVKEYQKNVRKCVYIRGKGDKISCHMWCGFAELWEGIKGLDGSWGLHQAYEMGNERLRSAEMRGEANGKTKYDPRLHSGALAPHRGGRGRVPVERWLIVNAKVENYACMGLNASSSWWYPMVRFLEKGEGICFRIGLRAPRFTPYISVTLLAITSGLHSASNLNDFLSGFVNDLWTSELAVTNLGLVNRLVMKSIVILSYFHWCISESETEVDAHSEGSILLLNKQNWSSPRRGTWPINPLSCHARHQIDLDFNLSGRRESRQVFEKDFRKVLNNRHVFKSLLLRLFFGLLLLMCARHRYAVSSLMDMAYWLSEH
ncbi:hypothetical protein Tco_0271806 [Tanacetum coccineum]